MKAILKAIKILMIAIKATKNTYDSIENKDNLDYFHREMVGRIISFHRTTTNCQKYQKSAKRPEYQNCAKIPKIPLKSKASWGRSEEIPTSEVTRHFLH